MNVADRVSEKEINHLLVCFDSRAHRKDIDAMASSVIARLIAERAVLEAKVAKAQELASIVFSERASRERGGVDDCYTDNARSRGVEHTALEDLLRAVAEKEGA